MLTTIPKIIYIINYNNQFEIPGAEGGATAIMDEAAFDEDF